MSKKETKAKKNEIAQEEIQEQEHPEELIIEHNVELQELKRQSKEYFELAQRTMADFDNFKKRIIKEKEMIYADAVSNVVGKFLQVLDNLEAALKHGKSGSDNKQLTDGIEMVVRQFKDSLAGLGVEEIIAIGEKFDPQYHYAVAHIDDDSYSQNEIVEEMQRGYMINEKVIRHSMVKVAN